MLVGRPPPHKKVSAMQGARSIFVFDDTSAAKRPPSGEHFRRRGVAKTEKTTPTLHGSKKKVWFPCSVGVDFLTFSIPPGRTCNFLGISRHNLADLPDLPDLAEMVFETAGRSHLHTRGGPG